MTLQTVTISEKIKDVLKKTPYVVRYVKNIEKNVGFPNIFDASELNYDMKKLKNVNIMYYIGEGIFVHIYLPPQGTISGYRKYVVIEPPPPDPKLLELLEIRFADIITEKDYVEDVEERKKLILNKLDKIVRVVDNPVNRSTLKTTDKIIEVGRTEYEYLKYYVIRDKIGLGVLEPFIKDTWIEDITCRGLGYVYLFHKIFGPLETNIEFKTSEELDSFVIKLAERIGKPVSHARPIVDATLPDGSRINIVYGGDVSLHGSNFTIRKFSKVPISITQLIMWNTLDSRVAAYMWMLLNNNMSGFICGETASGKTTLLNAISAFIPPTYKVVSIEDTAEVQLPHLNWVRELTRDTGSKESSVTMFDLLRAALRQRPNYIIVGEIRGVEAAIAFQAMQSVAWDTPILIRNKLTNKIILTPIGKFVDKFYRENEENIPKHIKNYQVLSIDKLGRVKWAEIKYVLRHKTSEIYEITYYKDKIIRATGSHSVFILDENTLEIKPKLVKKLKRGDLLVTFIKNNIRRKRSINKHQNITQTTLTKLQPISTTTQLTKFLNNINNNDNETNSFNTWYVYKNNYVVFSTPVTQRKNIEENNVNAVKNKIISVKKLRKKITCIAVDSKNNAVKLAWLVRLLGLDSKIITLRQNDDNDKHSVEYRVCIESLGRTGLLNEKLPLKPVIKILKELKKMRKILPELEKFVNRYENKNCRYISRKNVAKLLKLIEKVDYNNFSPQTKILIDKLKTFLKNDIIIVEVDNIRKTKYNGYVYDVSVPDTELFLGGEIPIALHNTGHPVLSTFHAASVERVVQRLTGEPIKIPKSFMDNLNFATIQSAVWRGGVMLRRVLSVNEIVGYDPAVDSIIYVPVFTWDPVKDVFIFRGEGASYLLENKIAVMRGISRINMKQIYNELYTRAKFLDGLVKKKIFNYYDVWRAIIKTYEIGLETALKKLEKGDLL